MIALCLLLAAAAAESDAERDEAIFGAPAEDNATDDTTRDDEVFGTSETKTGEPAPPQDTTGDASRDDRFFGNNTGSSEGRLLEALGERQDKLQIGGQTFLRLDAVQNTHTAQKNASLTSPNLFDLYFDARPTDRVRAYTRGRLIYEMTAPRGAQERVLLDQLWLKLDAAERVFITAGKQAIRWGSGHFWNPTDFLNPVVRNPFAIFDERTGVGLLKLHLPVESLGWNFYAIGNFNGARTPGEVGGALRGEFLLGETEIALSAADQKGAPLSLGADVSSAIGLFDVHVEAALTHGIRQRFFRGHLFVPAEPDFSAPNFGVQVPEEFSREDDWLLEAVGGAEITIPYGDQDNATVGVEYFYNQAGYDSAELYPLLFAARAFRPLYVGKHYAAAYIAFVNPGTWNSTTVSASGLTNISDSSYFARLDYSTLLLTYIRLNAFGAYHFGKNGELHFGFHQDPIAPETLDAAELLGVDFGAVDRTTLESGLNIDAPILEVGVGLTVVF